MPRRNSKDKIDDSRDAIRVGWKCQTWLRRKLRPQSTRRRDAAGPSGLSRGDGLRRLIPDGVFSIGPMVLGRGFARWAAVPTPPSVIQCASLSFLTDYRRAFIPGGSWFFTVNLREPRQSLLLDHIAALREAVANTLRGHPFANGAFVVLPDHLHAIWTLPLGDCDFSTRWRLIKSRFT
jgi:hypothetical protein